ncbi:hypothetical protein RISK_001800 [Rhodopirellula islandica]|uniref:Uncharacterized protein n=1 Tax=Rhodopirellula islandica TaxID=595434 RepID=A0A0J1EKB5_RHOIS|nr:hypothetical protein RISK_001800 [Rhodopirellula islandica]
MKSHQFAFFNCQFNFFNELHSVRTLATLPRFPSVQAMPLASMMMAVGQQNRLQKRNFKTHPSG